MIEKKCPCGSTSFTVSESYVYKAELNNRTLDVSTSIPKTGGIDTIMCINCDEVYEASDFTNEINFC